MLIKDIAKYIDGLGYGNYYEAGYDASNNIFLNTVPQTPNDVIVIRDYGGTGSSPGISEILRSVQIYVRNESMEQANYTIWAIYNAMIRYEDNGYLFINGRKMLVKAINPPVSIGKDANGLSEYTSNFSIWTQSDI
jgi:hypothetical protein